MSVARISLFYLLFILFSPALFAITEDLLTADEAFQVFATANSAEEITVSWKIAEGYYLYRNKFKLQSQTTDLQLGEAVFPAGKIKHDPNFGEVEIYRQTMSVTVPIVNLNSAPTLKLTVKYQGCADVGVCYPPQQTVLDIELPAKPKAKLDPLAQLIGKVPVGLLKDDLLPAEQAFQFFATVKNANTLSLHWELADGYYLYREKIKLTLKNSGVQLGEYGIPHGTPQQDAEFGAVEIFHNELDFDLPLLRKNTAAQTIILEAAYQGCADRGVCYPPMTKQVSLDLPDFKNLEGLTPKAAVQDLSGFKNLTGLDTPLSEQDQIVNSLKKDSLWLTLATFLGFGLLLSLTPCVFPMVPILSGIIVGQGKQISASKAFALSLCYVIATALTYTVFGVLAALFGSNLQATFQQPWVIALFSGIFIVLSLSMFGFYHLEVPKTWREKLHHSSDKHRDGSYLSTFMMGCLSSLIVGPCVAAPLAGALVYIGQTGNVVLGGSALFMMGFGMGVPLLIIGASAGKLLPKSGHWLEVINPVFGVIMLAVALWMLDRILPARLMMMLWAMLLIIPSIYLKAIDPLPHPVSGWRKLWKGLGLIMLAYGLLLLIGFSLGNTNPLQPLQSVIAECDAATEECGRATAKKAGIQFVSIHSSADLDRQLQQASGQQKSVMLDFYADWCISCKELETYTFTDPKVKQRLVNLVLLRIDMTHNTEEDMALLKRFNLVGPPAILFFGTDQQEQSQYRVIGYQDSATFLKGIASLGTHSKT
jgi:thiol:disulfide interchange protein DsbD